MKIKEGVKKAFSIFLGVESFEEMRKKGAILAMAVPAVRWMDWVLMGATASVVAFLKYYEFEEWSIFLMLWGGNMLISGGVILASDKTQIDLTLAECLRRLINAAIEKSKILGYIVEALLIIRLVIWDGPDNFTIFFRSRLSSIWSKTAVFILASGIQMFVWTWLYSLGYENFSDLFRSLF